MRVECDQALDDDEGGRLSRDFLGGDAAAERLSGRRPVFAGALGVAAPDARGLETACWMDASLDPKKLPNPPIVLLMSGIAETADGATSEGGVSAVGLIVPLPAFAVVASRSRKRFATSLRTPSNALNRLVEPAAIAVPIASRVGPSCS